MFYICCYVHFDIGTLVSEASNYVLHFVPSNKAVIIIFERALISV